MPITHIIKQGESISSIAYEHGLLPDTIWTHPDNKQLKEQRKDPNILLAGDSVFIPDKTTKEISKATGATHQFRRKAVPAILRIRFLDAKEKPRADIPYTLEVNGVISKGTTNAEGFLIEYIVPNAAQGKVLLGKEDRQKEYKLKLGYLDPITEISGIQARLNNLGFSCGDEKDELGEKTRGALKEFQKFYELPVTGDLDNKMVAMLQDKYLS